MSQSCQTCGACCAAFRVSFYWAETDAHPDGRVPEHLTTPISPFHAAMRGSERPSPRCVALEGDIGHAVHCAIYPLRSSTCREFAAGDEACARARQRHGLPRLTDTPAILIAQAGNMAPSPPQPIEADAIKPDSPPVTGAPHAPLSAPARRPAHTPRPRRRSRAPLGTWQGGGAEL